MTTFLEDQKMIQHEINKEMKDSYIDYAMSVIVSRALPDVRDGLKPVHRRILYGMSGLGVTPDKPHKKSARIVGEVMGKYHPHGDSSIYDAMVRLAQPFNIRYTLVDGHGNFGSVDGDGAAAMRYTEARMTPLALQMLRDIEKDTVDFTPNFDGEEKEPVVLPARFPNLLVNGSNGIAVGMATSIPPHNLGEVIDATVKLIDEPEATVDDLIKIVKGPDFPTGAMIMGKTPVREAYRTGQGKAVVRAVTEIEEGSHGKQQIVVTEIPYQVNKARLIEKIADLVRDKRVEGITAIRDESNRKGMRIVIELKRDTNANIVLNRLYKHTQLQDSISMIMLALVDGKPKILNLREMISEYLKHQKEVVTRRTIYDKKKAEARAHILEGYLIALDNIDEIIRIIRNSYNDAKEKLMERFELSEIQAQAILDMQLRRLQGLEKEKIQNEYEELLKKIAYYAELLADEHKLMGVVKDELLEIKDKWADKRRTKIKADAQEIDEEDLIEEEEVCITLTHLGYIKRVPASTYKAQKRGGKGITGLTTRENDFVKNMIMTSTHDYLMFFTSTGRVYRIKAYEIPEASRTARGTAIINLLQLQPDEKITAVIPINEFKKGNFLFMATKYGLVKKTPIEDYANVRKTGLAAIALREDDELIEVKFTDNKKDIILVTKFGQCIRFKETDVRVTGRVSMGVRGINLMEEDEVIGMQLTCQGDYLLIVSEKGLGKRTSVGEFTRQNRGGKGVKCYKITEKTGNVIGVKAVNSENEIMLITTEGIIIRLECKDISILGRITSGVKLMDLKDDITVASIAKVRDKDEEGIQEADASDRGEE